MNVIIDGVAYIPEPEQLAESMITAREKDILRCAIDNKGFDYAFHSYSDYKTVGRNAIADQRFHQLRKAYIYSRAALQEYLDEIGAMP